MLYILRQNQIDLPEALFVQDGSPRQICTVSRFESDGSVSGMSGSLMLSRKGCASEQGHSISYAEMLDMVLVAPKIMIL